MGIFSSPKAPPPPVLPPEPAQAKTPDYSTAQDSAGRRTEDRIRSGTNTVLTTPKGVTSFAPTDVSAATNGDKKTLLGQ
jgi:hypothetical protein